jgi:hypothetical protein
MVATIPTPQNQGASFIQVQRDKASTCPATWHPRRVPYYKALIQIPTLRVWYLIVKCPSSLIQQSELAVAALSHVFTLGQNPPVIYQSFDYI